MKSLFRNLKEERTKAMHKIEVRESLRQSYANRFSSKNEPKDRPRNSKKLRKSMAIYKKCVVLSSQIKEIKKK